MASHCNGDNTMNNTDDNTSVNTTSPLIESVQTQRWTFRILVLVTGLNLTIFAIMGVFYWLSYVANERSSHLQHPRIPPPVHRHIHPHVHHHRHPHVHHHHKHSVSPHISPPTTTNSPQSHRLIITRDEWGAIPPEKSLTHLTLPVNRIIIINTATQACDTKVECSFIVREIQVYHIKERKWDDIGYNFLIGGDGAVYEGRGWDYQGAHTKGFNTGSIGIAFIGKYNKQKPSHSQFDALKRLLELGVRLEKLTKDYKMYPHRVFSDTNSPGKKIIEVIQYWPHYVGPIIE